MMKRWEVHSWTEWLRSASVRVMMGAGDRRVEVWRVSADGALALLGVDRGYGHYVRWVDVPLSLRGVVPVSASWPALPAACDGLPAAAGARPGGGEGVRRARW